MRENSQWSTWLCSSMWKVPQKMAEESALQESETPMMVNQSTRKKLGRKPLTYSY